MSTRDKRIRQFHAALQERANQVVAVDVLATAAGYKLSSLQTYLNKNLLAPYVFLDGQGNCVIGSLDDFHLADLRRALSQRQNRYTYEHIGCTELVSNLLERSKTNAGLALELVNRPALANRLDAFVLLFTTAWEQLLKAELEHQAQDSIFTGERTASGRQKTVSFHWCLERVFPDPNDPVRRNIETLKDLRDAAAHLVVPETIGIATRYFQAGLLNYIERFKQFAQEPPFRFEGSGLLTLAVAYNSPTIETLRVRVGHAAEEVKALIEHLEQQATETNDTRFAISLDYHLVLDKNPGLNAIKLTKDASGPTALIVEKPRDPREKWPYTTKECRDILKERTGHKWTTNAVASVAAYLGVKSKDNEFHYCHRHGNQLLHQYSDKFIDKVCERFCVKERMFAGITRKKEEEELKIIEIILEEFGSPDPEDCCITACFLGEKFIYSDY